VARSSVISRPMLAAIMAVLSRGAERGGFCMTSTLLAKTVCPASDQLGRLSPDRQGMQAQFNRLAFAESTGGDWLGYVPTDINLSYQRNLYGRTHRSKRLDFANG
jgi:hypothetical protein